LLFVGVIGCGQFALGIGDRVPASLKKNLSIGRRAALVRPEVNGQGEARDGSMGLATATAGMSFEGPLPVTIFIVIPPFRTLTLNPAGGSPPHPAGRGLLATMKRDVLHP
jgi:hypothetical protein